MQLNEGENRIGDGVVYLGKRATVSEDVEFVFNSASSIWIGDYCNIGKGVKFVVSGGDVSIGDWTTLHDNCLVISGDYVRIGQHGWFGQNSVIDGSGGLGIGRGVRVGMYSQIWSHVAAGEQIEGCTLFGKRPVEIEDDVWLVGSCIVASGVSIGRRTIALIGSNITKSFPSNSVIAGSPAQPKTNLNFYRDIELEEKWALLFGWIKAAPYSLLLSHLADGVLEVRSSICTGRLLFVRSQRDYFEYINSGESDTVCCIENKAYTKRHTELEWRVLRYLAGNKARFFI